MASCHSDITIAIGVPKLQLVDFIDEFAIPQFQPRNVRQNCRGENVEN
jgi:hypothetical protein